jgi:hypothetical protein
MTKIKIYLIVLFIFALNVAKAQSKKIEFYKNGQNGIEIISKSKKGITIIISTYNAKLNIKNEVAQKFLEYYNKNNNISDSIIKLKVKDALVIGKCKLAKKDKVTNAGFYYQRVEWKDGLIEEYQK